MRPLHRSGGVLTDLELIRSAGPEAFLAASSGHALTEQLIDALGRHAPVALAAALSVLFRAAGHSAAVSTWMTSGLCAPGSPESLVQSAVVGARNEHGLAVLGRQPGDAALLWGADHLTGITDGLHRAGFRRVRTRWVSGGTLLPLWRAAPGLARLIATAVTIARRT
jgi:hypothetical protein